MAGEAIGVERAGSAGRRRRGWRRSARAPPRRPPARRCRRSPRPEARCARARAEGPSPAVMVLVRVVAAKPLSSQTNRTGRSNTSAQFSPSRNGPRLIAPSPKMQQTTFSSRLSLIACAAPAAMTMLAATTPFAPSMPTPKSAMCIEPPLPPQLPPSRPNSSRIMASGSAPLARVWPWPRWVESRTSSRARLAQTPAATASCPIEGWIAPSTSFSSRPSSAGSSKARMRHIMRWCSARRSRSRLGATRSFTLGAPGSRVCGGAVAFWLGLGEALLTAAHASVNATFRSVRRAMSLIHAVRAGHPRRRHHHQAAARRRRAGGGVRARMAAAIRAISPPRPACAP